MWAHADKISSLNSLRNPKAKRTNLLSSATNETFKTMNEISKKQRGLSNLTYKMFFGEESRGLSESKFIDPEKWKI